MNILVRLLRARHQDACWWAFAASCGAVTLLTIATRFATASLWDDAFFSVRYADHLISSGRIAWNPDGAPTYGLTAPLFLIVIVPFRLLFPTSPILAGWLSSFFSGAIFFVLLGVLIARNSQPAYKNILFGLVLFAFTSAMATVAAHLGSGMDTTFAMAFLTGYLCLAQWHARALKRASACALGAVGGIAFWARPDLMIYTVGIPAALYRFAPDEESKSRARLILGITALVTLGILAGNAIYFGTPLPLPFYAKSMRLYGDRIYAEFGLTALRELFNYFQGYWLFAILIAVNLFLNFEQGWRALPAVEKGMLVSTLAFIAYYLFFVLQIMPFNARFYHPTLSALAWLAASAAVQLIHRLPHAVRLAARAASPRVWIAGTALLVLSLLPLAVDQARLLRAAFAEGNLARFDPRDPYQINSTRYFWYHLDEFSDLPDDLVIAATETGRLGALNPRKTIVDLAGLNTPEFAQPPFAAEKIFSQFRPDFIYMPYRDYAEMTALIRREPYFRQQYEYFDEATLNTNLGVALWRESKYYAAMRQIMSQGAVR